MLVDEADGHGTLACGRCHPLDRSGSNIPCCEDPGLTGLARKRGASERPLCAVRRSEDGAAQHASAVVQRELIFEPADPRICTNEEQQGPPFQYPAPPA